MCAAPEKPVIRRRITTPTAIYVSRAWIPACAGMTSLWYSVAECFLPLLDEAVGQLLT
jgi:hypothetical protein